MKKVILALGFFASIGIGTNSCASTTGNKSPFLATSDSLENSIQTPAKAIITGADQTSEYLKYLKGKRVAMVVNQTSIIGKHPV